MTKLTKLTGLVPVGLGVVVLLVASGAWWEHRSTSDLPQRITVHSRDYSMASRTDLAGARDGNSSWQRVGTAGSNDRPVFATVLSGYTPTAVFVQLGPDSFEAYALVGGP